MGRPPRKSRAPSSPDSGLKRPGCKAEKLLNLPTGGKEIRNNEKFPAKGPTHPTLFIPWETRQRKVRPGLHNDPRPRSRAGQRLRAASPGCRKPSRPRTPRGLRRPGRAGRRVRSRADRPLSPDAAGGRSRRPAEPGPAAPPPEGDPGPGRAAPARAPPQKPGRDRPARRSRVPRVCGQHVPRGGPAGGPAKERPVLAKRPRVPGLPRLPAAPQPTCPPLPGPPWLRGGCRCHSRLRC